VSGVTIAVRILWVFGAAYSPIARKRASGEQDPDGDTWKNVLIVAWTGTRGVVSLATALALPLTLSDGTTFPQRSLILFLAFVVILMTLVIQGLSLPLLIKMLGVKPNRDHKDDERELRLLMADNVINFIENDFPDTINEQLKTQIKRRYREITEALSKESKDIRTGRSSAEKPLSDVSPLLSAQKEINKFQRQLLLNFHKEGAFTQASIRRLEQELDHEELQLGRLAKKKQ
jgi:CPA1 family monovalent cation:H+ antiporter